MEQIKSIGISLALSVVVSILMGGMMLLPIAAIGGAILLLPDAIGDLILGLPMNDGMTVRMAESWGIFFGIILVMPSLTYAFLSLFLGWDPLKLFPGVSPRRKDEEAASE